MRGFSFHGNFRADAPAGALARLDGTVVATPSRLTYSCPFSRHCACHFARNPARSTASPLR